MTVNITWSSTEGGSSIAESLGGGSTGVDHSSAAAAAATTERELWISHDGANSITNAGFYLGEFSGTYGGTATKAADVAELLAWGDEVIEANWGGMLIHFSGGGGSGWPVYSSKSPTNADTFRTGVGDSSSNKILVESTMGTAVTGTGIIAASDTDAQFFMKFQVPTGESTGIRQVDQVLHFTYTS